MESLLARKVTRPTTVRTLAKEVNLTGKFTVRELMQCLDTRALPRPFYLIAHRCNDLPTAEDRMKAGANAMECDIRFTSQPIEFVVNHDNTNTASRDAIKPYLDGLAKLLLKYTHVALVIFDLKEHDATRAVRLREIIRTHLTSKVPGLNIIMSQSAYSSRGFFEPIKNDMGEREAYAIDQHDEPAPVSSYFTDLGVERQCYGDGVFAAGVDLNITRAIMEGVALRWSQQKIRWVYVWTIGAMTQMRKFVAIGIDGIMVNDVPALKAVLDEPNNKKRVRLATRAENAFRLPVHPAYVLTIRTADVKDAGTDANVTFELKGSAASVSTTINVETAGLFERDTTNPVALIGTDVGTLQNVVLSVDNAGNGPGWYVDTVKVQKRGSPAVTTFKFGAWVEPGKPVSRGPS